MLKIGEFSRLSRVSIRMLRHYDELGLLAPDATDPLTGYRYYSEEQLATAGRIAALREMGFGLAVIGEMLQCMDDAARTEQYLLAQRAQLLELAVQTNQRIALVSSALKALRKDGAKMKYDVQLKTIPERYAACVRMTIPNYDCEGQLWSALMSETAHMNLIPDDPCLCCAVFLDGEHKDENVDVEIQKTVKGRYEDTEHVRFKTLPAVTVASTVHHGSYSTIGEGHAMLASWVRDNGYALCAPAFCIYHVSPHETSTPGEMVTEICYPVAKK